MIAPSTLAPPARTTTGNGGLPAHISATAARGYLACGLRFYFERVACIARPVAPALHLGKAVHAGLRHLHAALWRGGDTSPAAVERAYGEAFDALEADEGPVAFDGTEGRDKAKKDGLRLLAAYMDSGEIPKERPRGVEVTLEEMVPGLDVPLCGTIDLVCHDLKIVDFKTAASRPDPDQAAFDAELQLVAYSILLEAATGETPPRMELVHLVKTKSPQVVRVSVPPPNDARKDRAVAMLDAAVQGIAEGRFHPAPGMQCGWCAYRDECAAWTGGAP
ncbi:MAG TPA: PD-(D/E)XK nuclease family protein [Verrucomicrobiae bacterium]|nr:PD-(D/E)XK nuclease family protein [Verrucomicrobiae bacterium]